MPKRALVYFASGLGCLLFFVLFSYIVHKDLFTHLDFDTTVRLQNNISQRFNDFFSWFSELGKFEPTLIFLLAILAFWRKLWVGMMLFAGFVGFHFIELFGKFFVNHPPPPQFMLRTKHLVEFPQFHVRSEFSYPSGHSGRAVFLGVILLFIIWHTKAFSLPVKVILSGIVGGIVGIMLVSRVYLGEHWTTDVVGGSILGLSLSLMGLAFYRRKRSYSVREQKNKSEIQP